MHAETIKQARTPVAAAVVLACSAAISPAGVRKMSARHLVEVEQTGFEQHAELVGPHGGQNGDRWGMATRLRPMVRSARHRTPWRHEPGLLSATSYNLWLVTLDTRLKAHDNYGITPGLAKRRATRLPFRCPRVDGKQRLGPI